MPILEARAWSFSSLFGIGDPVLADTSINIVTPPQLGSNLQSPELSLQVNASSDIKTTDNAKNTGEIYDNALVPQTGLAGGLGDQDGIDSSSCGEPDIYVVIDGDTISRVAKMLGVTENTVLAANNMNKKLIKDDVLFIPSVSGVEHTVLKGQTLQSIAKLYKVDVNDITFCNGIASNDTLAVNDQIMIPGGQKAEEIKPVKKTTIPKDNYVSYPALNIAGFINPVPGYRLSQGLHDGNAVDLAIAKGTPIHAAAAGKVIFAKTGYNGGFGYLVIISHPNGTQTYYAHQSKIAVYSGEQVSQGQVIGYVGSTGHSTGPHVHFVVKGAFNPGINNSWAKLN